MADILQALQQQQQRSAQQAESLTERLNRMDAFQASVDPAIRAQALDFSGRPVLANPLDTIAGQLDLGEKSRNQRSSIADDLARAESNNLDALSKIDTMSRRGGSGAKEKTILEQLMEMSQVKQLAQENPELVSLQPGLFAEALGLGGVLQTEITPETPQGPSAPGMVQGTADTTYSPESLLDLLGIGKQESDLLNAVSSGVVDITDLSTEEKIQLDKDSRRLGVELPKDKALEERQSLIDLIDDIRSSNLGPVSGKVAIRGRIGGTDARAVASKLNRLRSSLTVDAREKLKGQGTITDTETRLLGDALAAFDLSENGISGLKEEALRDELDRIYFQLTGTAGDTQQAGPAPSREFNQTQGAVLQSPSGEVFRWQDPNDPEIQEALNNGWVRI